jgi:hypothetical protein
MQRWPFSRTLGPRSSLRDVRDDSATPLLGYLINEPSMAPRPSLQRVSVV